MWWCKAKSWDQNRPSLVTASCAWLLLHVPTNTRWDAERLTLSLQGLWQFCAAHTRAFSSSDSSGSRPVVLGGNVQHLLLSSSQCSPSQVQLWLQQAFSFFFFLSSSFAELLGQFVQLLWFSALNFNFFFLSLSIFSSAPWTSAFLHQKLLYFFLASVSVSSLKSPFPFIFNGFSSMLSSFKNIKNNLKARYSKTALVSYEVSWIYNFTIVGRIWITKAGRKEMGFII